MDKNTQGVYIGGFKGAELKNGLCFMFRSLFLCVLVRLLSQGQLNPAKKGWVDICPCLSPEIFYIGAFSKHRLFVSDVETIFNLFP